VRRHGPKFVVRCLCASRSVGVLALGAGQRVPCRVGRHGQRVFKREGDGASPIGSWYPVEVLYRRDRMLPPRTHLPLRSIRLADGWCDAPEDRNYNRAVQHPYPASAERLWRNDGLYDVVVILNHNTQPRVRRLGSAVFLHLMAADGGPTAGCLAVKPRDMALILQRLTAHAQIVFAG